MHITIVAVGKKRSELFEAAIAEYEKRLSRWVRIEWHILPTSDIQTESQQLIKYLAQTGPQTAVVLLDERGEAWSTAEFADKIVSWQNKAVKDLVLIIGGAHGVESGLRDHVHHIWSLSSLVFPHELVRVLVLEQLYRAYDLNAGGKYHHA